MYSVPKPFSVLWTSSSTLESILYLTRRHLKLFNNAAMCSVLSVLVKNLCSNCVSCGSPFNGLLVFNGLYEVVQTLVKLWAIWNK